MERLGPVLVVLGLLVAGLGLLLWGGGLSWLGRLPGDLRLDAGRTRVLLPLTSMVVLSVVLTVVVNLVLRWWR